MRPKFQKELPPPPPLGLDPLKTTKTIRKSLAGLQSCLFCPLCNNVFKDPVTLPACAHSFCQLCIRDYSCDNYNCPTCSLPITLRGSRAGGFDKTNPQIETVVSSFRTICSALNAAPKQWWNEPKPEEEKYLEVEENETYSFDMPREDENDVEETNSCEEEDEVMEMADQGEEVMDFQIRGPKLTMDDDATELFPTDDCNYSLASRRSCSLPSQSPNCSMIQNMCSQQPMTPEKDYDDNKENVSTSDKGKSKSTKRKHTSQAMTPTINNANTPKNSTPIDNSTESISSKLENNENKKRTNDSSPKTIANDDDSKFRNKSRILNETDQKINLSSREKMDQPMKPTINKDDADKNGTPVDSGTQNISSSNENSENSKTDNIFQPKNDDCEFRKKRRTTNETDEKSILSSEENIVYQPMTPEMNNDDSAKNVTLFDNYKQSISSSVKNSKDGKRENISQPKGDDDGSKRKTRFSNKNDEKSTMTPAMNNNGSVKHGRPNDNDKQSISSTVENSKDREGDNTSQSRSVANNNNDDLKRKTRTSNETGQKSISSNAERSDRKKRDGTLRVFIATKCPPKDTEALKQLEKQKAIEIVESVEDDTHDVVALCGNAEMETGDGWLIGLTYGYLWAMARGLPILHVSYLYEGPPYPKKHDLKQRVIGIGSSVDWMGPQRAVEATGKQKLLHGYKLILLGKFDKLPQSSRSRGASSDLQSVYSKTRIHTLLSLCGATVLETMPMESNQLSTSTQVAFLIRPNPKSVDWRAARKVVGDCSSIPVISADWLLDSLSDYRCKDWNNYTQASRHAL